MQEKILPQTLEKIHTMFCSDLKRTRETSSPFFDILLLDSLIEKQEFTPDPEEPKPEAPKMVEEDKEPQEAVTVYEPLAKVEVPYSTGRFPTSRYCLVEMMPKTGRKHQLRRHMAHLRHPIVGDTSHGDGKHNRLFRDDLDSHRLLLHASELRFIHPFTKKELVMKASLDETWLRLFETFEWDTSLVNAEARSSK